MTRLKIAPSYLIDYADLDRPQPLSDKLMDKLQLEVMSGSFDKNISDSIYDTFKKEVFDWIMGSSLNHLKGLDLFDRTDICMGCTQFIDNIYMQGPVQTLMGDYKYHERMGIGYIVDPGKFRPGIPLIMSMPFPSTGDKISNINEILNEATVKNIPIHIDGAWMTCCKDITFDLTHPAIHSIAISLSKGLGLGWNRIGLRWTKEYKADSISLMNDFHMINRALVIIGLHYVRNISPDHVWIRHNNSYQKICKDFNLSPSNSIHIAIKDNRPVGISPLIRYLENNE